MYTKDSVELGNIAALSGSNILSHELFTSTEVGMVVLDSEAHIKEFNKKFLDFIGYSPEELQTMTLVDLIHPDDRDGINKLLEEETETGNAFSIENRYVCKDGHIRWGEVNGMLLPSVPGELLLYATIADITTRKVVKKELENAEQQRECLEIAGQMAASFAHELNQPLAAIDSYAQASLQRLEKDPGNIEKLRELLSKIRNQVGHASEIIEHLRSMVRRNKTSSVIFDINELLDESVRLAEFELSSCDCQINIISEHEPRFIEADKIQIQQVILNLIHNAGDSVCSLKNDQKKLITIQSGINKRNELEISVADNGEGVPDAETGRLFEPFYTTKKTGLGIGLSICRTIVEEHGGKIWYRPNPIGGAIFHFSLPIKSALI